MKLGIIKTLIGSVLKPLPLSGIIKEVKELKQSKFNMEKTLKLAFYLIGGIIVWGVIFGKIDIATATSLLNLF